MRHAGGDLADLIRSHEERNEHFPEKQIIKWLTQLLMAVKYTHANHIIHRGTEDVQLISTLSTVSVDHAADMLIHTSRCIVSIAGSLATASTYKSCPRRYLAELD